ncbi:uncharacterized protein PV07_02731 [Cladophialophora immunda]|uniref:Uncharacterized protein n=1 Tax=Cladophialophora immunda TaxID=569365 RepID=A0A0D2CIV7_9EURO|nr:uncharacterized protein PV07_02731 [Cladophialophora immunda]KIW31048.1 hypothetical protein PV07_02731 [Cladophialophora immunda]
MSRLQLYAYSFPIAIEGSIRSLCSVVGSNGNRLLRCLLRKCAPPHTSAFLSERTFLLPDCCLGTVSDDILNRDQMITLNFLCILNLTGGDLVSWAAGLIKAQLRCCGTPASNRLRGRSCGAGHMVADCGIRE